jgi:hypothetical protein
MGNFASRLSRLETVIPVEEKPPDEATGNTLQSTTAELRRLLAVALARKERGEPPPPRTPESEARAAELRQLLELQFHASAPVSRNPASEPTTDGLLR